MTTSPPAARLAGSIAEDRASTDAAQRSRRRRAVEACLHPDRAGFVRDHSENVAGVIAARFTFSLKMSGRA